MSRVPETRVNYWREKLERNARRDGEVMRMLRTAGWRVLVIWECALRGPGRRLERETIGRAVDFIRESKVGLLHIAGINAPAESPSE
jgi:DNA mismatch endonuclease (patch repair protein)